MWFHSFSKQKEKSALAISESTDLDFKTKLSKG